MFTRTHVTRTMTVTAAGTLCLAALLFGPTPAQASRLPADPFTFVGTPLTLTRLVDDGHAARVRAALEEIRSDRSGTAS